MKIIRSAKSSLRFATQSKQAELSRVLTEYGRASVPEYTLSIPYRILRYRLER